MMRINGHVVAVMALAALAGCEEFTFEEEPSTEEELYEGLQDATLALREEIAGVAITDVADLPAEGSATYDGTALIALNAPAGGGVASELIGTATVTADFAAATVSGNADGFYGTVNGSEVGAYEGELFLSMGGIDTSGTGNQVTADANGVLQGGGDTLVIDGTVTGNFLGDAGLLNEPPPAIALEEGVGTEFTLNGETITGGMEVIAVLP